MGGGTRIPIFIPVVLVELADHLLQVGLREPRVDRCCLNVGVPEMFLHGSEIPFAASKELDATGMAERVRVKLRDSRARTEGFGDLPDAVPLHPRLGDVPALDLEVGHKERVGR